jgi:excisionase family DNA binding protein
MSVASVQPRGLNQRQAAVYLGCKYWAIRELCWKGELKPVRIGKTDILDVRDLDAWFEKEKKIQA